MTSRNGSGEWGVRTESVSATITVGDGLREWWTLITVSVGTFMLIRSSDFVAQIEGQRDGRPVEAPEPARA